MDRRIWSWSFFHLPIVADHREPTCWYFIAYQTLPLTYQYQDTLHKQSRKTCSSKWVSCQSSKERNANLLFNQLYTRCWLWASQAAKYDNLLLDLYNHRSLPWYSVFRRYFTHFDRTHRERQRSPELPRPHWSWTQFWSRFSSNRLLSRFWQFCLCLTSIIKLTLV